MDSGGFADFIRQVPSTIFAMLCVSGIALVLAMVFIVIARIRKAQSRVQTQAANMWASSESYANSYAGEDKTSADLPDLDMLINAPAAPAPRPAIAPTPASAPPISAPTPTQRPKRSGTYNLTLTDGRIVEAADVMTIARDLADGSLIVQIGEQAYPSTAPITDAEATRRFTNAIRELVKLASMSNNASAAKPAESPQPAPIPTPAVEDPPDFLANTASTPVPEAPKRPTVPPPPKGVAAPGDLPKYRDMEMQPIARGKGKKMEPIPELNIADAIEAYLQFKLQQSPDYRGHDIHVHPAPGGGVKIVVDGLHYDAVADVTDPDVRDFIAAAIQEWQERQ